MSEEPTHETTDPGDSPDPAASVDAPQVAGATHTGIDPAGVLATIILVAMTGVLLAGVAARLLFDGIPWAAEGSRHLTLWITFVGGILAAAEKQHLSLGIGERLLKGAPAAVSRAFTSIVTVATVTVLTYASAKVVQASIQSSNTVILGGIPEWMSQIIMPIGFGGMTLYHLWTAGPRWRDRGIALLGLAVAASFFFVSEDLAASLKWPLFTLLMVAVALGSPIYIAIGGSALLLFGVFGLDGWPEPVESVPLGTLSLVTKSELPMIPLLTFAGYMLAESQASRRLLGVFRAFFGWMPGGLAIVTAIVCAFFTTFTGGSGITILALGGLVLPALLSDRYPRGFSVGMVTAAGSLGLTFPPSFPLILYAIVAQNAVANLPDASAFRNPSIENLFIAGALPGLLLVGIVCGYGVWTGMRAGVERRAFRWDEAKSTLWEAKWEVVLPLIVLVAFFSGITTIVEAAAVTVLYVYIIEVLVYRDLSPIKDLYRVARASGVLVGGVLAILGVAFALSQYLVIAEIPQTMLALFREHVESPIVFLITLNVFLLVVGCLMDIFSAIIVVVPIITPIALAYGIDPVHLGIVFVVNLELGFLTPPVGMNLFLASYRFNEPLTKVYRHVIPFLLLRLGGVLLITYVTALTIGVLDLFVEPPAGAP